MKRDTPSSTEAILRDLLAKRILILDGAMGTMIQRYKLTEESYRGERFADFTVPGKEIFVKGNNELLTLTFCVLFLWGGWAFIQRAGKFSTAALGMPNTLYYMPALLGMVLLTLVCLFRVGQRLRELPTPGVAS